MKTDLISKAVGRRLNEVRERLSELDPQGFGEGSSFVACVKEAFREAPPAETPSLTPLSDITEWVEGDRDCLTSLRLLSLHTGKATQSTPCPPAAEFFTQIQARITAHESIFELLADRYRWPVNFSFQSEDEARELVLMRLMTADRARIEKASIVAADADDLLLKLNLVALHAWATRDLRFLDALNYYYELLPANWHPESAHAWLLVSWLALYARALNSWS